MMSQLQRWSHKMIIYIIPEESVLCEERLLQVLSYSEFAVVSSVLQPTCFRRKSIADRTVNLAMSVSKPSLPVTRGSTEGRRQRALP